jgi:hypothetical protein
MPFADYASYGGLGLAELVAKGAVTLAGQLEEARPWRQRRPAVWD